MHVGFDGVFAMCYMRHWTFWLADAYNITGALDAEG